MVKRVVSSVIAAAMAASFPSGLVSSAAEEQKILPVFPDYIESDFNGIVKVVLPEGVTADVDIKLTSPELVNEPYHKKSVTGSGVYCFDIEGRDRTDDDFREYTLSLTLTSEGSAKVIKLDDYKFEVMDINDNPCSMKEVTYTFTADQNASSKPYEVLSENGSKKEILLHFSKIVLGDIDGDNNIDAADASQVLLEYAAVVNGDPSTFTSDQNAAADVNGDNTVDASDASLILQYYSAVINGGPLPWGEQPQGSTTTTTTASTTKPTTTTTTTTTSTASTSKPGTSTSTTKSATTTSTTTSKPTTTSTTTSKPTTTSTTTSKTTTTTTTTSKPTTTTTTTSKTTTTTTTTSKPITTTTTMPAATLSAAVKAAQNEFDNSVEYALSPKSGTADINSDGIPGLFISYEGVVNKDVKYYYYSGSKFTDSGISGISMSYCKDSKLLKVTKASSGTVTMYYKINSLGKPELYDKLESVNGTVKRNDKTITSTEYDNAVKEYNALTWSEPVYTSFDISTAKTKGYIYTTNAPASMTFYHIKGNDTSYLPKFYVQTESGGLRLRQGPDTTYPIIIEMERNSAVTVLSSEVNGWRYVSYAYDGKTYYGFASTAYLTSVAPSARDPLSGASLQTAVNAALVSFDSSAEFVSDVKYGTYDVNNDGWPELFINYETVADYWTDIYYYNGTKYVKSDADGISVSVYPYTKSIMAEIYGGGTKTTFYKINSSGVPVKEVELTAIGNSYTKNGTSITLTEYNSIKASYASGTAISPATTSFSLSTAKSKGYIYTTNAPSNMEFYHINSSGYSYLFQSTITTDSGGLNLRQGPDTTYPIIIEMARNAKVYVLGHSSTWSYVAYSYNGATYYGFASNTYLK